MRRYIKHYHEVTEAYSKMMLVVLCTSTWFLYPVMLKFLAPLLFQSAVAVIGVFTVACVVATNRYQPLALTKLQKWVMVLWAGYLICLGVASVLSGSNYSIEHCLFFVSKLAFFVFLLGFIDEDFIRKTFSLYANISVVVTVLAIVVFVVFMLTGLKPFTMINIDHTGGQVGYYGVVYFHTPHSHIFLHKNIYRMQGLCEEPGTFALSLLPAFFWVVFVERSAGKAIILLIGLLLSFSVGAFIILLLLSPLILLYSENKKWFFISTVTLLVLALCFFSLAPYFHSKLYVGRKLHHVALVSARYVSVMERLHQTIAAIKPLAHYWFGVGSSLGMRFINLSIANGYAKIFLEAGIIGGSFYAAVFALLGWLAFQAMRIKQLAASSKSMLQALALSVLALIIMGAQRQQPDISFWQIWIYACFFYSFSRFARQPSEGVTNERY